jgi:hypothetical protein
VRVPPPGFRVESFRTIFFILEELVSSKDRELLGIASAGDDQLFKRTLKFALSLVDSSITLNCSMLDLGE